jgi:hypothetical protein
MGDSDCAKETVQDRILNHCHILYEALKKRHGKAPSEYFESLSGVLITTLVSVSINRTETKEKSNAKAEEVTSQQFRKNAVTSHQTS